MRFEKGKVKGHDTGFQVFLGGLMEMETNLRGEGPSLKLIDKGELEVLIGLHHPFPDDFLVNHGGLFLP